MKKKRFNIGLLILLILVFGLGVLGGMIVQQSIIQASLIKFGYSLSGTSFEVNIDLNETQLVDRMYGHLNITERAVSTDSEVKHG